MCLGAGAWGTRLSVYHAHSHCVHNTITHVVFIEVITEKKLISLLNLGLIALVMPFGFALCYLRYYILRTPFFTRLFNVEMQQEETEVEEKEEERRKGSKMHKLYI